MNLVEINLQHTGSYFLIVLFIVSAGILMWYYYRRTEPAVQRWRKVLLGIIRSIAFLSALLLLLEPVLSVTWEYFRPPRGVVFIDESLSMDITDHRGHRKILVDSLLRSEDTQQFIRRFNPHFFSFGKVVRSLTSFDSLTWNKEGTNIASVLNFLRNQSPENTHDFAVLISDGAYNLGENPLFVEKSTNIPLYTIAVGDSGGQTDISIHHILAPDVIYADQKIAVQVAVRARGIEGKRSNVTLREKGITLSSKLIDLPKEGRETIVSFDLTPSKEGVHEYLTEISGLPGEVTIQNNRQSFFIKVLKSKTRVLVLAGQPTPDFAFLTRALATDPHIVVRGIVEQGEGRFFPQEFSLKDFAPEAVILINYPTDRSSPNTRDQVQEFLKNNRIPLSIITGKEISPNTEAYYRSIVPLTVRNIWNREHEVLLRLTTEGQEHPVFQLQDVKGGMQQLWISLPPLFFSGRVYTEIPHQRVLAVLDAPRSGLGNVEQEIPLITSALVEGKKYLFCNVNGFWKWDLAINRDNPSLNFYKTFWGSVIRWLVRKDDERLVRIHPSKETYRSGEEITFQAAINDEKYQSIDGAQVQVLLKDSIGTSQITLHSMGSGQYVGSLEMLEPGAYTFEGKATLNDRVLGTDSGDFHVGAFSLEMLEPQRNSQILQGLAQATGGRYYPDISLVSLNKDIPYSQKKLTKSTKLDFWNSFSLLILMSGFLGTEWFLRKIWGML